MSMSERELGGYTYREINAMERLAKSTKKRAKQGWDGIVSDEDDPRDKVLDFLEDDIPYLADALLCAVGEIRRSHAEAARLREKVESSEAYWQECRNLSQAQAEAAEVKLLRERVESLEGALRKITKAHKFRPSNTFGKITWAIVGFDEKAVLRKCMEMADAALSQANAQAEPDTRSEEGA